MEIRGTHKYTYTKMTFVTLFLKTKTLNLKYSATEDQIIQSYIHNRKLYRKKTAIKYFKKQDTKLKDYKNVQHIPQAGIKQRAYNEIQKVL